MLSRHSKDNLIALQVEVTSRCTRSCAICPRSALPHRWQQGDLSNVLWERLEPALSVARHVHLQGWGEPLLHPHLPRMARAAHRAGCSVGITTNGDLLADASDWLASEDVDIITVSVAGEPETHAALRGGSPLEPILSVAGDLASRHRKKRIQLSYLLTRDNAPQLPALVQRAAHAGIREVFVTHLDCTPTPALYEQVAFVSDSLIPGVAAHLDDARAVARRHGLHLRLPSRRREELLACALDPTRFAFITWDGRVGPCVNQLLPIRGPLTRIDHAGHRDVEPACYGHLADSGLEQILVSPARQDFIRPFARRLEAERLFESSLSGELGVTALEQLELADQQRTRALAASPFPATCAGCHKRWGW